MERRSKLTPLILVECGFGAAAAGLYLLFLSLTFAVLAGGGESVIANALQSLAALAALWAVLFILLLIDVARARRFSWTAGAALVLVPVSAVAGLLASDEIHDPLCRLSLPLLPLAFGVYLLVPPPAASRPWAGRARLLALLSIAALSAYGVAKSAW